MKLSSIVSVALVLVASTVAHADILLTHYVPYTQNFNTMSAVTTPSSLMPADWYFSETGISANTTYTVGTGSSATSDTYSFGSAAAADRALGELTAANLASIFGAEFQNAGPKPMTKFLSIAYTGEQWRLGAAGRADSLTVQYSTNATSLTTGTWNAFPVAFNFVAPVTTGLVGARDGNASPNFTNELQGKMTIATPIPVGGTFWIRWVSTDASGADDGLAIDNFSITAIPEPSSIALCSLLFGAFGIGLVRRRRKIAR